MNVNSTSRDAQALQRPPGRRRIPAKALFFPAASLYAALLVPLSLWAMWHAPTQLPGLSSGLGHARELLFGFALAVVAGYLLGPLSPGRLATLFLLWLVARLGVLLVPGSLVSPLAGTLFAVALAGHLVPRFRAAKKWRNRLLGPLLLAICVLSAGASWLIPSGRAVGLQYGLVSQTVLLLALLMMFMGGRLIAPAVAGYRQGRGETLVARVQPRLEGLSIVTMGLAILSMSWPASRSLGGLALVATGLVALVRLVRWRLWRCRARPDLLCLGAGYGWLVIGLVVNGLAEFDGQSSPALIHIMTLGALGTLSSAIMMRTAMLQANPRAGADLGREWRFPLVAGLIASATLLRLVAAHEVSSPQPLLWGAAAAWSLAWLIAAQRLVEASGGVIRRRAEARDFR